MYKLCKTEQSSARQRNIEFGLLELMKQQRYEDITICDLCAHLQIPRKAFYRYFSGKDGALFALLDHTMLDFFQQGMKRGQDGTALGDLEHFFHFWFLRKELLDALQRSSLSGILVERSVALAIRERLLPSRVKEWSADQQGLAISFAVCGLLSMVIQWHRQGYTVSPGEMTRLATRMLTKPLLQM